MSKMTFTVGEIAALLGITPKAVKHYAELGLIPPPERAADNHYRVYGINHLTALQRVLRLRQFGLSLKQIGVIVTADDPDALARMVLGQHAHDLREEIGRLERQLATTEQFLASGQPPPSSDLPAQSALTALSDALKRRQGGLADALAEMERDVLAELDGFGWGNGYGLFWEHAGLHLATVIPDDRLLVFWVERYLALADMDEDDRQGGAWLTELADSPAKGVLRQALTPPPAPVIAEKDQQRIVKLLPLLLYRAGSPLQRAFLRMLVKK